MRRAWYAVVSFASVMVHQGWCLGGHPVPSIADIEMVWKARQAKVASAVFELETEFTIFKGSSSDMINPGRLKRGLSPMPESPPRDYLVKGKRRVSFSGVRTHDSYDDQSWDPGENRLYSKQCAEVFNGKFFKSLDNPSSARQNYPSGLVKNTPQAGGALKFPQLPIVITLRGVHPQYFNALRQFRVSGKTVPVADRSCLELVRESERGQQEEVLYVDPERDYVVAKMVILDERQPTWQWSATYHADPVVGWIPHRWEYLLSTSKGHRTSAGQRTVARYEINPKLDDSEFDITFPPGTRVEDEASLGKYVVYTISDSGERNEAIPAADRPTYEQLQQATRRSHHWLWIWGAVLLLSLVGVVWLRVRYRRRPNLSS